MRNLTIVQGRCPTCGPMNLPPTHLGCALPADPAERALVEFRCPSCDRWVFNPLTISEARLLVLLGARDASGAAPLELTEERAEPALSADDLVDFHAAIENRRFPQIELSGGTT